MDRREQLLSIAFVAFVAFKVVETAFSLENWPASSVSMFAGLRPRQFVPLRARLEATRDSRPVPLSHWDFGLSEDELRARLHPDGGVGVRCGKLVASYNSASPDPERRIDSAIVHVEPVPRPGLWNDVRPWKVRCQVPGSTPELERELR